MPATHVAITPEQHYRHRLASLAADEQQLSRRSRTLTIALVVLALFTAILARQASFGELPVYPAALFLIADFALLSRILDLRYTRMYRLQRLADTLETSLARATGHATQNGLTGEEFREPGHLYDRDL
ncbi:MAG: hypothetical protein HIU91_16855, partial [Acidobacteria bacterium]|nr:hypothetical protein [Acidobacteriota bacterium]